MNQYNHITSTNRLIGFDAVAKTPTVASTCTIISEKLSLESDKMNPYNDDIRLLLTGVIGLDTLNMDSSVKKGTPRDAVAYDYCSEYIHFPHKYVDRDSLYNKLSQAKNDRQFWQSLKVEDAIVLDYKMFPVSSDRHIGISAMLMPLQEFLTSERIKELTDYMSSEGLVLYAIMTSYKITTSLSDTADSDSNTESLNKRVFFIH